MIDHSFEDVATVVESEYVAPETCLVVKGPMALSATETWIKVQFLDGRKQVVRIKHEDIWNRMTLPPND